VNARAKKLATRVNRAPEIVKCALHTPDWLPLSLCYVGLGQKRFPLKARFRGAPPFEFRDLADVATWWQIFYRNVYPVEKDDRVVVDAGANIGAFTLYALDRSRRAKVIAIEAFPETFSRLSAVIQQSRFRDRVQLVNAALSSHSGWVYMQGGEIGSQFRRVLGDTPSQSGRRVPSCSLRDVLDSVQGEIDFLKMDIEGSEYASILAAPVETLRRIQRVAMEFHPLYTPDAPQPRALVEHLEKAGLAATRIQDHGEGYGMAYFRRAQQCF
jgi:FkbM family methyltransferase